jgi:hypothetical protein
LAFITRIVRFIASFATVFKFRYDFQMDARMERFLLRIPQIICKYLAAAGAYAGTCRWSDQQMALGTVHRRAASDKEIWLWVCVTI